MDVLASYMGLGSRLVRRLPGKRVANLSLSWSGWLRVRTGDQMKAQVQNTTVGELIAILFDETENLNWLKPSEKKQLVAYILNDLVRRSLRYKIHRAVTKLR
jgi:hypothetical protein